MSQRVLQTQLPARSLPVGHLAVGASGSGDSLSSSLNEGLPYHQSAASALVQAPLLARPSVLQMKGATGSCYQLLLGPCLPFCSRGASFGCTASVRGAVEEPQCAWRGDAWRPNLAPPPVHTQPGVTQPPKRGSAFPYCPFSCCSEECCAFSCRVSSQSPRVHSIPVG